MDSRKVFQIFVIGDDVNLAFRAFEVVSPDLECLEYCEEFFVMGVVV